MIAIIDYGVGNVRSIQNMIEHIGAAAIITNNPAEICKAGKIILPGVGAFDKAIRELKASGCLQALTEQVLEHKKPVLGICLGMQLLTDGSEEGSLPGLGWIEGISKRFNEAVGIKVPHMQWNEVHSAVENELAGNTNEAQRFYFAHSYYVQPADPGHIILECSYGRTFAAGIRKNNIYGVQFHPEKSHRFGKQLLKRFAQLSEN